MQAALLAAVLVAGQAPPPPPVTVTVTVSHPGYPTVSYTVRHEFGAAMQRPAQPTAAPIVSQPASFFAAPPAPPVYGPDWAMMPAPPSAWWPSMMAPPACPGGNCPAPNARPQSRDEVRWVRRSRM